MLSSAAGSISTCRKREGREDGGIGTFEELAAIGGARGDLEGNDVALKEHCQHISHCFGTKKDGLPPPH